MGHLLYILGKHLKIKCGMQEEIKVEIGVRYRQVSLRMKGDKGSKL